MLQVFLRKIAVSAREIADIAVVVRVEGQIADRSNQTVDPEGYHGEEEVRASSGPPTIGLETCMVDDQAADPTQEEGEQNMSSLRDRAESSLRNRKITIRLSLPFQPLL